MPKIIEKGRKAIIKNEMLRFLSIDGRASIESISKHLKMPKATTYSIFNEVVKEYGLHFVPEIDLEEVWKHEFIRISKHKSTKREMREEALAKIPELGVEEYITFVKFNKEVPSDEEITRALSTFTVPQFVAKLHGEEDLVIYEVGKSFYALNKFLISFSKSLKDYDMLMNTSRIVTTFGFFPIRNELIEELMLSDSAKALLEGLNIDGRGEIKEIAKRFYQKPELLLYAMERLKGSGLLKRITYFEAQPKSNINGIIKIAITNESNFLDSRNKWFAELIKMKPNEHIRYVYICDILNPSGILVFVNLSSNEEIDNLLNTMRKILKGVEINYITITKTLLGNLGIRNFDMHYSDQYKYLERESRVPKMQKKEEKIIA